MVRNSYQLKHYNLNTHAHLPLAMGYSTMIHFSLVNQIVNGMGGVGKSALAEKYAFLWQKMYPDGVFYFNAESLATLHLSIRKNVSAGNKLSCDVIMFTAVLLVLIVR